MWHLSSRMDKNCVYRGSVEGKRCQLYRRQRSCARADIIEIVSPMLSERVILRHIARQPKKTAGYKQLVREVGVKGDERREFAERLHALVKNGELLAVDSDRYAIPQTLSNRNMIVGRLSMHRDGYGFVI